MAELCKLDDLKGRLGILLTDAAQDDTLRTLIAGVSDDFLNEIRRQDFTPGADWTEFMHRLDRSMLRPYDGVHFPRCRYQIFLRHYPVNSIATVEINGGAITAVTDPNTDDGYFFDEDAEDEERQSIFLLGEIGVQFNSVFPPSMKVVYNGGYDEVPAGVRLAVMEWAAYRSGLGQVQAMDMTGGSRQIGTYSETGDNLALAIDAVKADIPVNVQRVINQYRREVI